jgi:hypothetical protein
VTALVTLPCDRLRGGQPCRGAFHTRARQDLAGRREAAAYGWTATLVDLPDGAHAYVDTCPSPGHDEP